MLYFYPPSSNVSAYTISQGAINYNKTKLFWKLLPVSSTCCQIQLLQQQGFPKFAHRSSIMGNSDISCLRPKPKPNLQPSSISQPSLIETRNWKTALGYIKAQQDIPFDLDPRIVHPTFVQIEKDLSRTYPDSPFFLNNEANVQTFRRVLQKLAVYFPKVGYTQGINFMIGYLLISGLSEIETFTLCVKIMTHPELMLIGLFQQEFPLNRLYCHIFWLLLQKLSPEIHTRLAGFGLPDQTWIFKWFMTGFIMSLPFQFIGELWTYAFDKKMFAFIKIALAVILQLGSYLKTCHSMDDFLKLLEEIKSPDSAKTMIKLPTLLRAADKIRDYDVLNVILTRGQPESVGRNEYSQYFSLAEGDRKKRYLEIFGRMVQERKQFLKDCNRFKFSRSFSQTSILDQIESRHGRLMYFSMKEAPKPQGIEISQFGSRLWKSGAHNLRRQTNKSEFKDNKQSIQKMQSIVEELSVKNSSFTETKMFPPYRT